ncbi:hypothetical protein ACTG9Q_20685 [Actinokineospora sp. 24-640]
MTARTHTPLDPATARDAQSAQRIGWAGVPGRLRTAVAVALGGALLAAAGSVAGLVADGPAAGFGATPLLVLLALLPAVAAAAFVAAGRPVLGAGVLAGAALLAPGRALIDLQLAADGLLASRPEILVPASLAPLDPGAGLWLVLAGHVLAAVAGLLVLGAAGAAPGSAYAAELAEADRPTRARSAFIRVALFAGTVAAVGLLLAPFASDNAFVLALSVIDGPPLVRYGLLAVAVGAAAAAVLAAGAAQQALARGLVTGMLAAVAAVTVPQIAAGLLVERLHPTFGPYLALAAAAALAAGIWSVRPAERAADAEVRLDARGLHLAAGVLGLLTGAAALVAAFGAQLVVTDGLDTPPAFAGRLFIPVALAVLVLAVPLLAPRAAAAVRPAFTVALAAVPFAAAGSLDAAFTATGVSGAVTIGAGVWFAGIALALACATAVTTAIAGGAERDDVDLTDRRVALPVAAPAAVAALLAVGAYGLPVLRAPDLVAPGIWTEFRFASWGLLIALAAVLAATALAPLSRPPRAAALLLGAAVLVGTRALEYPLTVARAADGRPGQGLWLALACVGALVVAAATSVSSRR